MDTEINERLDRIEKMVSDNNRMLGKLRQGQKNAIYMRLVYWVIIIVLGIVSLYFITPYLGQLGAAYGIGNTNNNDTAATSNATLTKLLNEYQAGQKAGQ